MILTIYCFGNIKLFRTHPDFKQEMHEKVRHILVDEYQDTNVVQHELLKHLAKRNNDFAVDSLALLAMKINQFIPGVALLLPISSTSNMTFRTQTQ